MFKFIIILCLILWVNSKHMKLSAESINQQILNNSNISIGDDFDDLIAQLEQQILSKLKNICC